MSNSYFESNILNKLLTKVVNKGGQQNRNLIAKISQIITHGALSKSLAALNLTLPPSLLLNPPDHFRLPEHITIFQKESQVFKRITRPTGYPKEAHLDSS